MILDALTPQHWRTIIGFLVFTLVVGIVRAATYAARLYNTLVNESNTVDEAFARMDVYMKKRYDLVPNLVETVMAYAKHESDTLAGVAKARSGISSSNGMEDKFSHENALHGWLKSLFAVAEQYPELKADSGFLKLQAQLHDIEEDIAKSRERYNLTVKSYNIKVERFPNLIFAKLLGFKRRAMFSVSDSAEREAAGVRY